MRIKENMLRKNIRNILKEFFLAGKKNKSLAQMVLGKDTNRGGIDDDSYMYDEEGMHLDDYGYYDDDGLDENEDLEE